MHNLRIIRKTENWSNLKIYWMHLFGGRIEEQMEETKACFSNAGLAK